MQVTTRNAGSQFFLCGDVSTSVDLLNNDKTYLVMPTQVPEKKI